MKIMPVVFKDEEYELEFKYKELIYKLFFGACKENGLLFLTKIIEENIKGYIIFNKSDSELVKSVCHSVNEILSQYHIEYMVSIPVIMDGVRFTKPTFYMDGKIEILK